MKNTIIKIIVVSSLLIVSGFSYAQTGWMNQYSGTSQDIRGSYFINSLTGWAACFGGVILKTTNGGQNWNQQFSGTSLGLISVHFVNENTGWAAGGNQSSSINIVLKTTNGGLSWFASYYSSTRGIALEVFFVNSNTGWIVCGTSSGLALKTTNGGLSWTTQNTNIYTNMTSCFFLNQNTGWIVGDQGSISKTTNGGNNWMLQYCSTSENLEGIYMLNSNTGFVVGNGGYCFKTTNSGLNWIAKPTGSYHWLNSVYFINDNTGWIVGGAYYGGNSQIFKTTDSGENWVAQTSPTTYWLADVKFVNSDTGWAVGRHGVIINTRTGGSPIPQPPTLISPPNNSVNISTTPTLTWNTSQGAVTYHVQISTVANFQVITDSATVSSTQYQIPVGTLMNGYTYFWRVNAANPEGTSAWSDLWSFSTGIYPPAPVLISPPDGFIGTTTTPTLLWDSMQNITSYRIEISRIPNFLIIGDSSTIFLNQYIVPPGILFDNITYFWRVNASNSFGTGPWSSVWSFTPQPSGINPIAGEIPKEYKLFQNYPNPFNPETNVKFNVPVNSHVKLIVYDALGRVVKFLLDRDLNPGSYEIVFNGESLNSGIYFLRMESDEFHNVRRMVLIK